MTYAEWLAATDPRRMFDWLCRIGWADRHRLGRLFVECCDRIPPSVMEAPSRSRTGATWADDDDDQIALTHAEFYLSGAVREAIQSIPGGEGERAALADAIRDIAGNPFRAPTFDPSLRTEAVAALAGGMHESRDFVAMPGLADALADAGCSHPDLLAHCRGDGPHVRGCWVVDLVLGKG